MKKLLKIVGALVLGLVVLVVAAVVVVPMLVDPQDLKDELSARVKDATGRELSIPGEVELSVFPWLGASLGQVSLGNAAGFQAPVFASTEKVDVRVKFMPLFDRRLEMDTLTVHGLTLNLERNARGKGNWEDLAEGKAADGTKPAEARPADGDPPALAGFAIGGVDVRDANVSYTDAQAGQSFAVRNLAVKVGAVTPGEPVDLELGFDLDSTSPPLAGRVTAAARVEADPDTQVATVSGLEVKADVSGEGLPGGKVSASLGGNISVDGARQSAAVRDLVLSALGLDVTGRFDVTGLDKTPALSGELTVAEFSPRKLIEGLGQAAPETADADALTRASLTAGIAGGPDSLALAPLTLTLDGSTLKGEAKVTRFAAPAVRFALSLDAIDVDRYLPPGQDAPPATPGAAAGAAGELPLETLRALDVAGTLDAGKVTVAKLSISDLKATLNAKDGLIRLSPVAAKLYDGSYAGNIGLDARGKQPVLSLDEKLTGVQAGPLLADLQGGDAPVTGTANVSAKLSATGTAPQAVKSSLDGNIAFQFLDGAVNGVNVGKLIRDARARLRGASPAAADEPAKTDFAEITGTATVTDGVISNQDLSAKSPLLRVAGKGTASLPAETVDYRATVTVVGTSKGQGGKELDDLSGVPIPLRVSGTFADPSYGLDMEGLAQAVARSKAKDLVDEQKGKITEKVEQQAKEKLGDSVGNLLGGDKKGGGLLDNLLKKD